MASRKFKISVTTGFIDKTPRHKKYYREGFHNVEYTLDEIAEAINLGCTISYQFRDGIRSTQNFIGTDFLAVDVDSGLTLQEAKKHPVVKKYCSILYVTPSHTSEEHRFRLIFTLPRTITKASDLKMATTSLAKRLSGDIAATDAARIFHGCRDSYPTTYNRGITEEFLLELIEDGRIRPEPESIGYSGSTSVRSEYQPNPSRIVRMSNGVEVALESIKERATIYCPFHDDRNPSAFVARSFNGSQFIYCASCRTSWYVRGTSLYDRKFEDFDLTVRRIKNELPDEDAEQGLGAVFGPILLSPENISISKNEYLEIRGIDDGLTLIKSPKGTGKTTYLSGALSKIISRYATLEEYETESDSEAENNYFSDEKVLLIGHRQALIGELCKRLHLNSYLDERNQEETGSISRKKRYGICLDSLQKIKNMKYDIIVIDEVEQVLSHFLSDTIGEKRYGLFVIFCDLIRSAKKVVALDADLGWITYMTLAYLAQPKALPHNQKNKNPLKLKIYINDWLPKNRVLHVYESQFKIIHEIKKAVIEGRRIFVTANSKAKIKAITNALQEMAKDSGIPVSIISVTSDNSGSKQIQHFIKNIKTEILNYQVILSSPSMGTGIDITFENGRQEIDCVFGLFENQINTHFEIDQQLARVRNPGSVHVWVSPRTFTFETDFRVVASDFLHRNLLDVARGAEINKDLDIHSEQVDPFLRMAALILSHQRASKNRLRSNFLDYRKRQGWTIQLVESDDLSVQGGKQFYQVGKDLSEKDRRTQILASPVMDRVQFLKFKSQIESGDTDLNSEDWYSYYRTRLELFYGRDIDEELLSQDRNGDWRGEIALYMALNGLDSTKYKTLLNHLKSKNDSKNTALKQKLFRDRDTKIALLYGLLSTTPIFKNGSFIHDINFSAPDLIEFIKASNKFKEVIQTQLEINTQSDLEKKPTQHLSKILSKIGLKVDKATQKTIKGNKVYFYCLNQDSLQNMEKIAQHRANLTNSGWDYVNQKYGFTYSPIDLEWLGTESDHL